MFRIKIHIQFTLPRIIDDDGIDIFDVDCEFDRHGIDPISVISNIGLLHVITPSFNFMHNSSNSVRVFDKKH